MGLFKNLFGISEEREEYLRNTNESEERSEDERLEDEYGLKFKRKGKWVGND